MFWKLQENVVCNSDLDLMISFMRETKRFTQFEKVREFEEAFSTWQGCKYCVFVNSGSSANLILISAVKEHRKWKDGDEVIVPAVTWPTSITPVIQLGLRPVFVDVNLTDLSFDYDQLEKQITSRTRGIFLTHLLGFPANIERCIEIISGRDIQILEDCCESQGAKVNGTNVGNLGLAGTFSFYWGHHMTTIEGGMICTNNEDLYKMLLLKRSHGLARELPTKYHAEIKTKHPNLDFNFIFLTDGFNVRNTELNAVLGLTQLGKINEFIKIRNNNYGNFVEICKKYHDEIIILESKGMSSFVFPFIFHKKDRKVLFQQHILNAGIEFRPLISGNILQQPIFQKYSNNDFINADFIHTNAFYIGNNQFVNEERLKKLSSLMSDFFQ